MKRKFQALILLMLVVFASFVFAIPENKGTEKAESKSPAIESNNIVPPQLSENELKKVVFIRYHPNFAKEKPCNNNGVCDKNEKGWCSDCKKTEPTEPEPSSNCYDFLTGSMPKWDWIENYYYSSSDLGQSSGTAAQKWNVAAQTTVLGQGIPGTYAWGRYDNRNSVSYGDYAEEGVIGVTMVWYRGKTIYEYDIMYDTDFFPGALDLDTVVLHEMGHAAGMGDLYSTECSDQVMYGIYRGVKTELQEGDILGIQTLY